MAQIFFETFGSPALFIQNSAVSSLYATGRTTGCVLESGLEVTRSVPVVEGSALEQNVEKSQFGGRNLTDYLMQLLNEKGYAFCTKHAESAREIKEKLCYVAMDPIVERKTYLESAKLEKSYKLPDGSVVTAGSERFDCAEHLFTPLYYGKKPLGIHELLQESIWKCDRNLKSTLCHNIVLSGGSTMFPGLDQRLLKELNSSDSEAPDFNIVSTSERLSLACVGGSIFASLSTFETLCVSKSNYDEVGPWILHRMK